MERTDKYIWMIASYKDDIYLKSIFVFLYKEFSRIFGEVTMRNEACIVHNDSSALYPMLITNQTPIRLRLAQQSLSYWSQTIYQLSHELCHYAIRQHKENKGISLSWFEEPICEAMSLYSLHYSAVNWESCELYHMNQSYSKSILEYLQKELIQRGTDSLKNCNTLQKLKAYERIAANDRAGHRNERNKLYYAILRQPLACSAFCDYQKYINTQNGITICFDDWMRDNPSPLLETLCSLQPLP